MVPIQHRGASDSTRASGPGSKSRTSAMTIPAERAQEEAALEHGAARQSRRGPRLDPEHPEDHQGRHRHRRAGATAGSSGPGWGLAAHTKESAALHQEVEGPGVGAVVDPSGIDPGADTAAPWRAPMPPPHTHTARDPAPATASWPR